MAAETRQAPVVERTPQPNRLKIPEIKKAVSRGAEAVRSKISGWLDKNKQPAPQEDPAIILTEIATQKPDSIVANDDTKNRETNDAQGASENEATMNTGSNSEYSKQNIRQFSKSTEEGRLGRSETAKTILEQRATQQQSREAQTKRITLDQEIVTQRAEKLALQQKEFEDKALLMKAELSHRSTSWVAHARALMSKAYQVETEKMQRQIPKVESDVRWNATLITHNQEEVTRSERQFQQMADYYRANPAGERTLKEFYEQQGKLLEKHEENIRLEANEVALERYKQEHGTVSEIAKRYDAYLTHGISFGFGGTNNDMLADSADWRDKLAVVASEKPPLSGSMVKKGIGPQQLWSPIGVLIKEGVVAEADSHDLTSRAVALNEKKGQMRWGLKSVENYEAGLQRAVNRSSSMDGGYNEYIMEFGAKSGAFFINIDHKVFTDYAKGEMASIFDEKGIVIKNGIRYEGKDSIVRKRIDRIDYSEMFGAASFVGLPVVAMKDGIVYECSYGQEKGLILGRELSPQDITSLPDQVPTGSVEEIKKRASSVLKTVAVAERSVNPSPLEVKAA